MLSREVELPDTLESDWVRDAVARRVWMWFEKHKEEKIGVRVIFFSVSIRLEQLRPLFIRLFGDEYEGYSLSS